MAKNRGQFGRGKDPSKMGRKGGHASGGNTENLPNVDTDSNSS